MIYSIQRIEEEVITVTKLLITQYTDPMCVWCYAMEPSMRKIQYLLGDKLEYRSVCGVLVADVKQIIGDDARSDMRFQQLKLQMREHFLDAARRSGVPVDPSWLADTAKEDVTSLPMTLAFEAVKLQNPERANAFLTECRANSHARTIRMNRRNNIIELARNYVDDLPRFESDYDGQASRTALVSDLALCRAKSVSSFPTIEFSYGDASFIQSGYLEFDQLASIIDRITNDAIHIPTISYSLDEALRFLHTYKTVSGADLKTLFDLTESQLEDLVQTLIDGGSATLETCAEGYFLHEVELMGCVGGTCSI